MNVSLVDLDEAALQARLREWGHPPSHAATIFRSLFQSHGRIDYAALPIGRALAARLTAELPPRRSTVRLETRSADGTRKLLVGFEDGSAVESVLMPAFRPDRAAGCVSSQVGCAMGCDFCASTRGGFERNLAAGEIVDQVLHLCAAAASLGRRLNSLVFMGMGEPMLNLEQVTGAIRRITHPNFGMLGGRAITVSTVGIIPGIDRLSEAGLNVHLALSLHAPDDETRSRLVPSNRRYPVADIMEAVKRFLARTRRVPTIEYCMLAGVNDSDAQARELARLMSGFRAHVNLIPYNAIGAGVSGVIYQRPSNERVERFLTILRDADVVTHVRVTRGDDVNAACGQLRESAAAFISLPQYAG